VNACNHRRPISAEHRSSFPGVDFSSVDTVGPPAGCEWTPPYKRSFGLLRRRAARVLAVLDARAEERIAVVSSAGLVRAVLSEVMGLGEHCSAKAPRTGQVIEVLRVETPGGGRYWEIAATSSEGGGHEVQRLALRDEAASQQRDDGAVPPSERNRAISFGAFLSHCKADAEGTARALKDYLEDELAQSIFLDSDNLHSLAALQDHGDAPNSQCVSPRAWTPRPLLTRRLPARSSRVAGARAAADAQRAPAAVLHPRDARRY
jgi:hypothetical protein